MRLVAFALLTTLVACTGGGTGARTPGSPSGRSVEATPTLAPHFRPSVVTMFVGLDAEEGLLATTCERGSCRVLATPKPKRYLPAADNGLVSFATGTAPKTATMELRRAGKGTDTPPVQTIDLAPRTLMATTLKVPAGRYVVTLVGAWPDREARWVFGLQGSEKK